MSIHRISKSNIYFLGIILIFTWGIALRAVELINGNYLFGHDQGRDMLIARTIIENKKLTLIGNEVGSGVANINGIFHGPGYHYILALAYYLFQGDAYGGLVMMFLSGILSLVLGYLVARIIYGKTAAIFILFFLAISPLIVSQSRFVWSSHLATPVIIAALYCIYKISERPGVYAPLACFFSAFVYHSQLGVAVPMLVATVLAMVIVYRIRKPKIYIVSFLVTIVAFAPMILFEFRHDYLATKGIVAYVQSGQGTWLDIPTQRLLMHAPFYYFNFINTFTFEFGFIPQGLQVISVLIFLPIVLYIVFFMSENKNTAFHHALLLTISVTWVLYLLLNNVVWDYYLMHTRIAFILLFGYASSRLILNEATSLASTLSRFVFWVYILVLLSGTVYRMYVSYTVDLTDKGSLYKISGKKFAIDSIYSDAGNQPFQVLVFTPYVYTYPYDYLFQTYGKQKYGYEPGSEKQGLAYLIIEPDYDKPWRHLGWLETVVQGGTTVFQKKLVSDQLLEKRIYH